jgi:hypothetical protein
VDSDTEADWLDGEWLCWSPSLNLTCASIPFYLFVSYLWDWECDVTCQRGILVDTCKYVHVFHFCLCMYVNVMLLLWLVVRADVPLQTVFTAWVMFSSSKLLNLTLCKKKISRHIKLAIHAWSTKYRWNQKLIAQFDCTLRDERFESN